MTNTTPAAVERFTPDALAGGITPVMRPAISGKFVRHSDYAALSAKLEAANQRADTAHAQGRAEGLREAAGCIGHITRHEDLDAILAIIPADTPSEPSQEAAQDALMVEHIDLVSDACRKFKLSEPHFRAALRAITGGRDE